MSDNRKAIEARQAQSRERVKAAHLHHAAGMKKTEIARLLKISTRQVFRLLEQPAPEPPKIKPPAEADPVPGSPPGTATGSGPDKAGERGRINSRLIRSLNRGPGPLANAYVPTPEEQAWADSGASRRLPAHETGMVKMTSPDGARRLAIEPQEVEARAAAGWSLA